MEFNQSLRIPGTSDNTERMNWGTRGQGRFPGQVPPHVPSGAQARFLIERTPLPHRPHFPPVADRIAAQFSPTALPGEFRSHFYIGNLAISVAFLRLGLLLRRGGPTELADSCMPSSVNALVGSPKGMFRCSRRSSLR